MNNEGCRENCPYCGSLRTVRNGVIRDKQTYLCKDCGKRWRPKRAVGGHSHPPEQIGTGICRFYITFSTRDAAKFVKQMFGIEGAGISPQTILNWVNRYTDSAMKLTRECKVSGWGEVVAMQPTLSTKFIDMVDSGGRHYRIYLSEPY